MCTTLLVGKKASYDGSTLVVRSEDSPSGQFEAKGFQLVEPQDQPRHYQSVCSACKIDLPDNPLRYTCLPNIDKSRGIWGAAGVNAENIAMTATETITTNERVQGADPLLLCSDSVKAGGIGEEDFVTLVLPYIHSARDGVRRLGQLLEQFGTYESNGIAFQDVDEIWWLETIGGHHWMARRVPDDCYVVMPNQLGIDAFDLEDALGAQENFMCSADLREFIAENHLDLSLDGQLNPRDAFGSHSNADHTYNTPRAWVMLRYFNPRTYIWDGPDAEFRPEDDDLPWSLVPEKKISIEDVKTILSNHYQGTPYDPYGKYGDSSLRGKYRPIGINRDNVLALTQIRPYLPEAIRSLQWLAYGCDAFNAFVPYYTNIHQTPAYLAEGSLTPSTENFYWANRFAGALCDAHFAETASAVERYQLSVQSQARAILKRVDQAFLANSQKITDVQAYLEQANAEITAMLRQQTDLFLDQVLYAASCKMKNGFARSDA